MIQPREEGDMAKHKKLARESFFGEDEGEMGLGEQHYWELGNRS